MTFLRHYDLKQLKIDALAGVIIALVSIPISMGYAQVAGLPAAYGLYGSVFPILLFGLLSTSPRFVFGVDAAPAALCGGMLANMGIAAASPEALQIVPVLTLFVGLWLLVFHLLRAGSFVKYISSPVMGGFITGIGCEIILMQVPKLFGGRAGHGELPQLLAGIVTEAGRHFHGLSFVLGLATVAIILLCRTLVPRIPVNVIIMGVGALLTMMLDLRKYGVLLLPAVERGLPPFVLPNLAVLGQHTGTILTTSLTIALVIMAESLLATNNFGMQFGDAVDNNREILAYAVGNLAAALTGCCPVNGSVSRTSMAIQFGVKSQMMSVIASAGMVLVLLLGTGMIAYLPVPVLTGIVIAALISILEFDLAKKLHKADKVEFFIFLAVFFAVLFLGTLYGVLAGVILSFVIVIVRSSNPPRAFLGCIPGRDGFFPLGQIREACPIKGVLIYQFKGPLFFANIDLLRSDIEAAIREDTRAVIVDAGAVSEIDVTAAEQLLLCYDRWKKQGVQLFLVRHHSEINDSLRTFGARRLIDEKAVRPFLSEALQAIGLAKPYPLEENDAPRPVLTLLPTEVSDVITRRIAAFQWAYGEDADARMKELVTDFFDENTAYQNISLERLRAFGEKVSEGKWSSEDKDRFLDMMEMAMVVRLQDQGIPDKDIRHLENKLIHYHAELEKEWQGDDEELIKRIIQFRLHREKQFRREYPASYQVFEDLRAQHREILQEEDPGLYEKICAARRKAEALAGREDSAAGKEKQAVDAKDDQRR